MRGVVLEHRILIEHYLNYATMQTTENSGYFTVFIGKDYKYYFNLKAGNHEIILQSEGYESKANTLNGIRSVQENCQIDQHYKRKIDKDSKPYFVLVAGNGEPIGKSESYSSEIMMEKGIESVKKNGKSNDVRDESDITVVIHINTKPFKVTVKTMTGNELLQLVGQSSNQYSVFLLSGNSQDEVQPTESIRIRNGMHFQTIIKDIKFG